MAADALLLYALSKELNRMLKGGRIVKVNQPEKDELILQIYANGNNYRLHISINGTFSRINITEHTKDNPLNAPSFCMHLRKELDKGVINSIEVKGFERIITINLSAFSELYDVEEKELQIELMGKYNNIVLVKKGTIVDCMKRIPLDVSIDRPIIPGATYALPTKQDKIPLSNTKEIGDLIDNFTFGSLANYLSSNILGISYNTAREFIFRSFNEMDKDSLTPDEAAVLKNKIDETLNQIENNDIKPCVLLNDKDEPVDTFFIPYLSLSNNYKLFDSLSKALDYCFFNKSSHASFAQKGKSTQNIIKNNINKYEKKLGLQLEKQLEYKNYETNRVYGDLILSNMHFIKKGDEILSCTNYEDNKEIKIKLDKRFTPQQNAQNYYKKYNKQKRSIEMIDDQIKETKESLDFLYDIKESFRKCTEENELKEIEQELIDNGYIKQPSDKKKVRFEQSKPNKYEFSDATIYVGKNNIQNEHVTFEIGVDKDMWFHVKNNHGSHVILKGEKSEENIRKAAELAALYSDSHSSEKVEVDYTFKSNVKKLKNKRVGMVTYSNQTSIMVSPRDYTESLKR